MQPENEDLATWSDTPLDQNTFLRHAHSFSRQLSKARNFNDLHSLWQKTRLPYLIQNIDPNSDEYVSNVKSLYSKLTGQSYEILNELCTTKMDEDFIRVGFPWSTGRLDIISAEMAKVVQALRAFHQQPGIKCVIEFGAGWGNLAVPMARSGLDVTVVDIDKVFLERISELSRRSDLTIKTIHSDFLTAAQTIVDKYDAVVFQSSFHHCLEFDRLIGLLRQNVLKPNGIIYFFSEPVFDNYNFPWGLRFDGESLWAITQNKWLELGFDRSYFANLMLRHGLFLAEVPPVQGIVGPGYRSVPIRQTLPFEEWVLPTPYDATFHPAHGAVGHGRFCRNESILPQIEHAHITHYDLDLICLNKYPLRVNIQQGDDFIHLNVQPSENMSVSIRSDRGPITLASEVFVPAETLGNGDSRELGISIVRVACR